MKLIKAIVRPNKVEEVSDALQGLGISGLTVTEGTGPRQTEGTHSHLPREGIHRQSPPEDGD